MFRSLKWKSRLLWWRIQWRVEEKVYYARFYIARFLLNLSAWVDDAYACDHLFFRGWNLGFEAASGMSRQSEDYADYDEGYDYGYDVGKREGHMEGYNEAFEDLKFEQSELAKGESDDYEIYGLGV